MAGGMSPNCLGVLSKAALGVFNKCYWEGKYCDILVRAAAVPSTFYVLMSMTHSNELFEFVLITVSVCIYVSVSFKVSGPITVTI